MLLIISMQKKKITAGGLYSLSPFLGSFSFPGNSRWRKFINEFIYRMSRMGSHTLSLGWPPSAFTFLLGGCFYKQVKCPPRGLQHKSQHFHEPCWIAMSQVWGGQDGPADEDENHSPIRERRELECVPLVGHLPLWCICLPAGAASPLQERRGSPGAESDHSWHTQATGSPRAWDCRKHGQFCFLATWNDARP